MFRVIISGLHINQIWNVFHMDLMQDCTDSFFLQLSWLTDNWPGYRIPWWSYVKPIFIYWSHRLHMHRVDGIVHLWKQKHRSLSCTYCSRVPIGAQSHEWNTVAITERNPVALCSKIHLCVNAYTATKLLSRQPKGWKCMTMNIEPWLDIISKHITTAKGLKLNLS